MNENEAGLSPESVQGLPKTPGITLTTSYLQMVGTVYALLGIGLAGIVVGTLTAPPGAVSRYVVVGCAIGLGSMASGILLAAVVSLLRAREGRRLGYCRPLSHRESMRAAAAATFFAVVGALAGMSAKSAPLALAFLMNPLLLGIWFVALRTRTQTKKAVRIPVGKLSRPSRLTVEETTPSEAKPGGHWWTDYNIRQQKEESQTTTGRRS